MYLRRYCTVGPKCGVQTAGRTEPAGKMADTFRLEGNKLILRAPGVWTLDGSLRFNFVPPHIARFPCRMAVIKIDGGLLIWSPLRPEPEVLSQVMALGTVRWIVAPNSLHWLWAGPFARAVREAGGGQVTLLAAPGLKTKPEAVKTGVVWDAILPDAAPSEWEGAVRCIHIKGIPLVEEVVLIHLPSGTLFGCELAFNFQRGDQCLDVSWPMNCALGIPSFHAAPCLASTPCCCVMPQA